MIPESFLFHFFSIIILTLSIIVLRSENQVRMKLLSRRTWSFCGLLILLRRISLTLMVGRSMLNFISLIATEGGVEQLLVFSF